MSMSPRTIHVHSMTDGVPFVYDETGTVEVGTDYDYSPLPSRIHHYLYSDGMKLFVFVNEENAAREKTLVRADSGKQAGEKFDLWLSRCGRSVRTEALTVFEVFE